MEVPISPHLRERITRQLQDLYHRETRPFLQLVPEYTKCVQHCRDLEVRVAQLDKEAAELRDENVDLHARLQRMDEGQAADWAAKAKELGAEVERLRVENLGLVKDKSRQLEELLAASSSLQGLQDQLRAASNELHEERELRESLQEEVLVLKQTRDEHAEARQLASSELQARRSEKEAALSRAEAAERELHVRVEEVLRLKTIQAQALNDLNREREEMRATINRAMMEIQAEKDLVEQLRKRMLAAAGPGAPATLRQSLGLAGMGPAGLGRTLALPSAPIKTYAAHRGGCCSIDFDRSGNLVATCGVDRTVQAWELTRAEQTNIFHGMLGCVNDVCFTSDGQRLLGAGADKSLRLWDVYTGNTKHTLTGHTAAVTAVACSPLEPTLAVSCSEDRSLKLWDLGRGYLRRSIPVVKMPNALCISTDGNVIVTGHLDGTLCFWDRRQCESASVKPFAESKEVAHTITCVTATPSDGGVLTCSRDNAVRHWDLRTLQPVRAFRAPGLAVGTVGSMGRGKNRVEMSSDGRWVAAGATDGTVVVWDTAAASASASIRTLKHHNDSVVACGWSTDCSVLVSADKAGTIAFWQCT